METVDTFCDHSFDILNNPLSAELRSKQTIITSLGDFGHEVLSVHSRSMFVGWEIMGVKVGYREIFSVAKQ